METGSGAAGRESSGFRVTFVCTGNRARSPVAQELLRPLVAGADVSVDSYGTLDLGPVPALPEAQAAAAPFGVDLRAHHARPLRPGALAGVDLVVGFEPTHVATAVVDGGVGQDRCFTIGELADLLELDPSSSDAVPPARAVARAHARRSGSPLSAPSVPDPLGGTPADFRTMVETLDRHVAVIARGVFGVAVDVPDPTPAATGWRALVERLRSG